MSDERWNSETTDNQFTEPGSSVDNSHIVDVAAEVIDETNETSGTASNPYAEYADAGSATGNGTYHYENTSHEYYQGENYGSSMGGSSDGGSGGRGKGFLAVVLAIVFGVCIGAGFWGVHRYLGSTDVPAETAIAGAAENKDSAVSGEKNAEADTVTEDTQNAAGESGQKSEKDKASADADAAAQEQKNNAAAETQTTPAQQQNETAQQKEAVQQETTASAANTGIENEAGLIIADVETPETELTKVVDTVMPSIVSVYNDFTEEVQTFYGQTFTRQGESTGSGIIIGKTDTELLIVTNNHVVDGADHLRVLFIDQETCDAEIKGTNPSNDLAVIAVALSDIKSTTLDQIKVATLGNSDNLKIGEDVIAIGNALGYGQSVTTGIVSANNREISDETITGTFIQTDAAINPGNSGGALVNINGHVIGINSSKIGGNAVEGMGFAIPISRAIPIIEELMSRETLSKVEEGERGTIGISGVTVTSDVAKAYNMPQGVYVAQIIENGGAAKSDLHEGDIITAIDGQTVSSMEELQKQLEYHRAGTEVTLTVQRQDGKGSYAETAVKVTLGTRASIENQGQQESQDDQSQQGGRYDQGRQDGQTEQDQQDGQTEQDQQSGQNGRNGYNDQSEQNGNIQGGQDPFSLFEQFGFPFGF